MQTVRAEIKYVVTAIQFLTRIPSPHFSDFESYWLDEALKYFPMVGALVGALCALVLLVVSGIWNNAIASLVAVATGIAVTGAFHEDGLADFFDALGGNNREVRLAIMKDSRLGTYGALALGLTVGAKIMAISTMMPVTGAAGLIAAHSGGRLAAVFCITCLSYAGEPRAAKIQPLSQGAHPSALMVAAFFGIAPLILLPVSTAIVALASGSAAAAILAWRARAILGGYTGDVLGAMEQAFEVAFLLGVAACV